MYGIIAVPLHTRMGWRSLDKYSKYNLVQEVIIYYFICSVWFVLSLKSQLLVFVLDAKIQTTFSIVQGSRRILSCLMLEFLDIQFGKVPRLATICHIITDQVKDVKCRNEPIWDLKNVIILCTPTYHHNLGWKSRLCAKIFTVFKSITQYKTFNIMWVRCKHHAWSCDKNKLLQLVRKQS